MHEYQIRISEVVTLADADVYAKNTLADTDRVKLHFEIRRQGKPVDPARYLPPR